MEISSRQTAFQNVSHPPSSPSPSLLAIQIALAFRISQLPSTLPVATGLPPLPLPSKLSRANRNNIRKLLQQLLTQAESFPSIVEDSQPKDSGPVSELKHAEEPSCSCTVRPTAGEDRSGPENLTTASSSVLVPGDDGDAAQALPPVRRRPETESVSADVARHPVSGVPLVDNLFEHAGEDSEYLLERSAEIVPEGNFSEESLGSQAREFPRELPQESEISIENSAQEHVHRNRGSSLTTGSQLGNSNSWSAGYDSEVEDNVGSETGQADYKKRRRILYPETDYKEGASVYRMPGEQTEQNNGILSPTQWAIAAFQFQVQLIVQAASCIESLFQWGNSYTSNRIGESWQVKDRATEAVTQRVAEITSVPPKISEVGTILVKRAAWGCLAATYIFFLLGVLLVPALFLEFAFVSQIVEEPASIRESIHFDYTKPHPTAVVLLRPLQRSWGSKSKLARHYDNLKAIPLSHRVHITVKLTLPESDNNRNIGMFQLTAELLSENGEVVKSSSRPCMLRYHSAPIRLAKTFLTSLPSLMGIFFESQTLVVHVMEFEEQHVLTGAVRILLQPKAGMRLGAGIPELYSAEVHIESLLPWPKEFLRNWKWTFYIWTALVLYIMEILVVLCCCRQILLPSSWFAKTQKVNHDRRVRRAAITPRDTREQVCKEG